MHHNSLVTIICTCYNQHEYVTACLDSVISQDYSNIEIIIVDDCSTDDSKLVIENWIKSNLTVRFLSNETNLGITKSFNNAARYATGTYLVDLAADDLLLPHFTSSLVKKFNQSRHNNLGIVYGNAALVDHYGDFKSYYFDVNTSNKVLKKRVTGDIYTTVLTGGDSICSVSAMIKKAAFDQLQGYDESLAYEDLDFWIRCSRNYSFDFLDDVIMQKRNVQASLSSNFSKKNNRLARQMYASTYSILTNTLQLNSKIEEDLALQKRVHHSIIHSFKNGYYQLTFKYVFLRAKLSWRKIAYHYTD
ncbi:glycosyltransferase [Flavobacterium faecale]|uniref:Glycosyltransferase n=1 Tax=Flavobacterium faecale TaxID=1355330 RepID=A0A2S1LEE5_9FLAO|nr:glycosyltransferase [Flavobacterium faecale]AWG22088.1 glycosyltransferase [Flavobacterium faecale]